MTSDGRGEVGWGGRRSASGSTLRWPVSDPGDSRLRPGPCEAGASVGAPSQAVPGRFREALPDPGRAARRGPPQTLEEVAAHTRQRSCRREAQNPDRVRRQTSPLGLPPHETPAASRFAPRQSIRVASEVFACPAPDGRMTPAARVPAAAPLWVDPALVRSFPQSPRHSRAGGNLRFGGATGGDAKRAWRTQEKQRFPLARE